MKRVFGYVGRYKLRLFIGLTIKVIGTITELFIPYILSYIVDYVVPTGSVKNVIMYGLLMILCSAIGFIFNVAANRSASFIAKSVTTDLRHDLFTKIESLSSAQIDEVTMPSLISRMTTDTYNIHQMVGMMQRIGVRAPILLIGGIIIAFTMDPILTLILIAILPLVFFITILISKIGLPIFTKVQESLDHLVRIIRENVTGIRVIKALSKADYEKQRFNKVNKEVMDYELKSGYTMTLVGPIMNLLLNMGLVFVVVVGAQRVINETSSVGKIISFTQYFTIILNAMMSITRIFAIYSRSNASAIRIDYIFNLQEELLPEDIDTKSEFMIEFKDVSFSYNKNKNNISNVSFKLKKGESLGIIGPTGAGKTTIISLLMRWYDIDEGEIFVDGKNIKSYDKHELRRMFGSALQNDTIFTDTIKNNIDFYRDLDMNDIVKASETAQASEFINSLENKYDEDLSAKGTNISGGQKQRIYIARALASNPQILIMDDSSSALDYKTDANLRNAINKNYPDTTSIIIAQRISSIMNCSQILMIDNGFVLGIGTHEYLLNTLSEYKEIFISQMGDSKGGVKNEF